MKISTRSPGSGRKLAVWMISAVACVGMAVSLSACGGAGSVLDPVAKAATLSDGAPGYRMVMYMTMSSPSLSITATGTGSFDRPAHSGSLQLSMQLPNNPQITSALGGSSTLTMQEIVDGLTFYIGLPPSLASKLPGGRAWLEINLAKAASAAGLNGGGLSALTSNPISSDPSQFLQYLRATSGSVTKVGQQTVLGFNTTHYRATIDLSKVPNLVAASERATVRQTISQLENLSGLRQIPMDVWVDTGNRVRQLEMSFTENVSGQKLTIAMRLGFPVYGPQPAPTIPPASQVTNLSDLEGSSGS